MAQLRLRIARATLSRAIATQTAGQLGSLSTSSDSQVLWATGAGAALGMAVLGIEEENKTRMEAAAQKNVAGKPIAERAPANNHIHADNYPPRAQICPTIQWMRLRNMPTKTPCGLLSVVESMT